MTDPVRVFLIDLDVGAATALSRAIDLDRELAVVGVCRNLRRVRVDADHCRPDLIAVRLDVTDPQCVSVLAALVEINGAPSVLVLGSASGLASCRAAEAALHKKRIRAVAEADFGVAANPAPPVQAIAGARLH
ncbi:MAG: hypothetical protein ACTSWI_03550 [Alphaproteobacteria bacterium]